MKKYIVLVLLFVLILLIFYVAFLIWSEKGDVLPSGELPSSEQTGIVIDVATASAEEIVSALYEALPDDGSGVLVTWNIQ